MASNTVYVQGSYVDVHDNEVVNLSIDKTGKVTVDGKPADNIASESVRSDEHLAQAIERCQEYFWGNSSYAVLFCLQRDVQKKEMSQSAFERMVEMLPYRGKRDYQCPTGTIANAFSDNEFFADLLSKKLGQTAHAMPLGRFAGAYGAALLNFLRP